MRADLSHDSDDGRSSPLDWFRDLVKRKDFIKLLKQAATSDRQKVTGCDAACFVIGQNFISFNLTDVIFFFLMCENCALS